MPYKSSEAQKTYHRAYYKLHRREIIDRTARWGKSHPKERLLQAKTYRIKHHEARKSAGRLYANNHKPQRAVYHKHRYSKLRDQLLRLKRHRYATDWRYKLASHNQKLRRRTRERSIVSGICSEFWKKTLFDFCHRCAYCGKNEKLTIDHFIPFFLGGHHVIWNVLPSCVSCNASKGSSDPKKWCKPQLYRKLRTYLHERSRFRLSNFIGGYFMGNIEPSVIKTRKFEIAYKTHKKGEKWPAHYQLKAVEINCLVRGKIRLMLRNRGWISLKSGDVFVIEAGEIAEPHFLEDCELVVVKIPSVPKDKVVV